MYALSLVYSSAFVKNDGKPDIDEPRIAASCCPIKCLSDLYLFVIYLFQVITLWQSRVQSGCLRNSETSQAKLEVLVARRHAAMLASGDCSDPDHLEKEKNKDRQCLLTLSYWNKPA